MNLKCNPSGPTIIRYTVTYNITQIWVMKKVCIVTAN